MSDANTYYIIYKPFGMLSQFSREHPDHQCLADLAFDFPKNVYPVGRLDKDSEGLLLLTNDTTVNARLLNPKKEHRRTYWVQVDGAITDEALQQLERGVEIKHKKRVYRTKPAQAQRIEAPQIPPRNPPIRYRANIPTSWIKLTLTEGKNRQVRRMTAKVGFPTLRLLRASIEGVTLENMHPGEVRSCTKKDLYKLLKL